MQDFLTIMKQRGFVHQCTDEAGLSEYLKTAGAVAYIGFDCTAPSLHVGSLLQIMLLRWWQKCRHRPIVLLGGGTTKIGDPSGKDESRPPLSDAQIQENMKSLKQVFSKFIEFGEDKALMVNNDEWLSGLNYAQFLREYGRHFSINRMLTMDSVKLRLERDQHLSFLEFNYMILQAYDFVELNKTYGCRVQMGGSDQWGNIVNGVELGRKLLHVDNVFREFNRKIIESGVETVSDDEQQSSKYLFGITSPLITTSSGAKMGKTAAGAVWLNADLCSPYDYWQFWRNTEDADVEKFLKLFTELSLEEIARITESGTNINEAKKILATEATALLHGREEAQKAEATARAIFEQGGISENLPEISVSAEELAAGTPVYLLLVKAGFAASNGEARRLLKGGGAKLNDAAVAEDAKITQADFAETETLKLSAGKKRHALVRRA